MQLCGHMKVEKCHGTIDVATSVSGNLTNFIRAATERLTFGRAEFDKHCFADKTRKPLILLERI